MILETIRILYVDDDPDDLLLFSTILKKIKNPVYQIYSAASFEEALEKTKEHFDVYLVDYKLGKETGLELIKEIKSIQKHAPVIMLTGMNTGTVDQEAMQVGASDYLIKGEFDAKTLDRTLRYAIRDSQLMESLDHAAMKFRSIFERAGDPFLLMDGTSKILEANPIFTKKFGIEPHSEDSTDGYFFSDLITDQLSQMILMDVLGKKSELFDLETELKINEENQINALISIVKQDVNLFQVMIKDLTAMKAKEEEELNLKKFSSTGRIARLLAHEVKNPLTTIVLSADQLQMELPEDTLKESGDLIDVIQRNCNRINQLVTQLLESTRFTELDISNQSINDLLDEALEQVKDRIQIKGFEIFKNYQDSICNIDVDAEKVKIALINLLVNAVEAMPENGGKLFLKTYIKGKQCRLEIKDNGEGIPKENLERLFEPFYTSKEGGSGLGLTNTQNIILSHGGSIRVKSEEGTGTTFIISFSISS
ncbi:hybrid sensor histidine kinase/response regulator [Algoriphagus sp.]|uniref:hybrid sensor histidine kinase/response regulator n=1 Tax=Algoriphagus sp. TaxID=1872435 RepID=UPI0025DCD99B|nr:hybrid sensor histidine kinase/response regulator [Algoriphagus sp.]